MSFVIPGSSLYHEGKINNFLSRKKRLDLTRNLLVKRWTPQCLPDCFLGAETSGEKELGNQLNADH